MIKCPICKNLILTNCHGHCNLFPDVAIWIYAPDFRIRVSLCNDDLAPIGLWSLITGQHYFFNLKLSLEEIQNIDWDCSDLLSKLESLTFYV